MGAWADGQTAPQGLLGPDGSCEICEMEDPTRGPKPSIREFRDAVFEDVVFEDVGLHT